MLFSILTTAIAASLLLALAAATPGGSPQGEDTPSEQQPAAAAQTVETACYSFEGPAHYTPNTSATSSEACFNTFQLWGELALELSCFHADSWELPAATKEPLAS